ncbi:CIC11C00000003540 [Sungouiella intermedia]|uniref:CIC11C00000003540 n=1 Tax=Sungouiella intermedia TaxID=45354 RepID=A0A1L0BD11_9ASCO|nr:CIC11C00000003540 [[Candida] intermedia]
MSKETASTKHAIEAAQTSHKQNQPILVSGCTMKDYQLDGLEWLIALYENGLNGILADEMGLGKTLQCIALIAYLLENGVKGPFLVVAPLSTVPNWCREFARFAPKIKVLQYTGSKDYRKRFSFGKTLKAQVVVTSYDLVIKDIRKFQRAKWTYLTVDEGHRLKNFNCTLIRLLKKLDVGNRLLLTGTPLQNNLKELWSLLNFILPDIFHDLELFELWFDFDNLEDSVGDTSHEEKRLIQAKIQELFVKNLHSVLKPFLLRRIKKDVMKGLPPKKEYILFSSLTPMQSVFYKAIMDDYLPDMVLTSYIKEIEESSDNETFYSVNEHSNNEVIEILSDDGDNEHLSEKDEAYKIIKGLFNKFVALVKVMPLKNKIMQMRKVCNTHLSYFNPYEGNNDAAIAKELMETSGKFQMLLQLLRRLVAEGHKVLVFSQFTTALDYIRIVLDNEGFLCNQFDGRTKHEVREEEIEEFSRDGPDSLQVFLLSTRSGGLGINLVKADTVILFDNDWNPQMDIQAIDRAHRIGQTRPVKVFRFVVRQTVEELLILRSFSKRLLERMVIQDGDFHLGGVARKLAEKNIEISSKTKMSTILELSEKFNLQGSTKDRKTTGQYNDIVLQPHSVEEPLTVEEMDELMDRSDAAYTRSNFSFANVTTFETSQLETQS